MAAVVQAAQPSGRGYLARPDAAIEAAGEDRGSERLEVRLARRSTVKWLELLGCIEQQWRSVAAASEREHDLGAEASEPGALELVERARSAAARSSCAASGAPRLELRLRRGKRAPTTLGRIRGQLCRSREERGRRGDAAASLRAPGRALQLVGDGLVETRSRVRAMPCAPIGLGFGIGRLGQSAVHLLAVEDGRRLVDRRAHQRVTEPHMGTEIDQLLRLAPAVRASAPRPSSPAARHSKVMSPTGSAAASSSSRGSRPGATRASAGSSARSGSPEASRRAVRIRPPARPGSILRGNSSRASGLPCDSATTRSRTCSSRRPGTRRVQQRAGVLVTEPSTMSSGSPPTRARCSARAPRTPGRPIPPGGGALRTRATALTPVQPLSVVDDPDQRLLLGDLGEQAEDGQTDDEAIGRRSARRPNAVFERVTLRAGQPPADRAPGRTADASPHTRAPSRTRCPRSRDATPRRALHQVLQQRRLADPRFAAHDQHLALTRAHTRQQSIESVALVAPTAQHMPRRIAHSAARPADAHGRR